MSAAIDDVLSEVFRLLAERAGMAADALGIPNIAHTVRKRAATGGATSPQDYLRRLEADPAEFQEFLEDLVVPETWFFRDALAFRCLTRWLDAARARPCRPLRVLSAGCSTGEEAYSLAISLREAGFDPAEFRILATDVSRRSLDLARQGTFACRSFRECDATADALRGRWCEPVGESWRVREDLLACVEFRWGNLAQPDFLAGEQPFQVIFCRNVLIYFHAEARRMAVRHLQRLLSPDGLLCAAPAESRILGEAGFRSLGSECPFGFRHRDESNGPPQTAATRSQLPVRLQPRAAFARPPGAVALPLPSVRPDAEVLASPATHAAVPEPFAGQAILDAAKQAADDGRLEEADALCGKVLSRDPASAAAYYLRGVVHEAQGLPHEAQQSLEKALYLDPKHYEALVHMMLLAEQRGDQQAATNYRRRAQQAAVREAR